MILLPSVSSVYSFFFYRFMIFFSFGLQKELFFQIVICRFLLCEIASFCLFFFDEGDFNDFILFVDVLQISSFEGSDCWNFPLFIFLLMMFVEVEVEVEGLCEMFMFGITSEPCTGKLYGIFFNVSRVLDFIECLEMIVVDLAWICRIAVACILWCKCRISFLLLFLLNEIGWFF